MDFLGEKSKLKEYGVLSKKGGFIILPLYLFAGIFVPFGDIFSFGLWFGIVWCWRSISCFRLLASLPYMSIMPRCAAGRTSGLPLRMGWRLRLESTKPLEPERNMATGDSVRQIGSYFAFSLSCPNATNQQHC